MVTNCNIVIVENRIEYADFRSMMFRSTKLGTYFEDSTQSNKESLGGVIEF